MQDEETLKPEGKTPRKSAFAPPEIERLKRDPERCPGQYVLVERIGAGGMGTVWKAWDTRLTRWVAVKFLNAAGEDESVLRFQREAQLAARLRHANIASIYEVNERKGRHYIAMEFVNGRSLEGRPFPLRRALEIVRDAARAVHYAHRNGIIHRDLKPANLLEAEDGRVVVTDFGLAKTQQGDSSISMSGTIIGTPQYMPPEQATGAIRATDSRSDVYSLGATLYSLLTGQPPFTGENTMAILLKVCSEDPIAPRKIDRTIPAPVEAIVLMAMEKDKSRRYESAERLADDLDRFLEDREVSARPLGAATRMLRKIRKNPWPTTALAAVLAAAAVVAVVLGTRRPPPPPAARPEEKDDWRARWTPLSERLALERFRDADEGLAVEGRTVLASLPEPARAEVESWFLLQAGTLPRPAKADWLRSRAEIEKGAAWCEFVLGILPQECRRAHASVAGERDRLARIVAYRGKCSLLLYFIEYAELLSLKSGDEWIVREGKLVAPDTRIRAESLHTPLLIDDLDIGPYAIELRFPDRSVRAITVEPDRWVQGGAYMLSGSVREPERIGWRRLSQ